MVTLLVPISTNEESSETDVKVMPTVAEPKCFVTVVVILLPVEAEPRTVMLLPALRTDEVEVQPSAMPIVAAVEPPEVVLMVPSLAAVPMKAVLLAVKCTSQV